MKLPDSPEGILKAVWGYDEFRPLQADIIRAVLRGEDTLGLLPTGGGKSITFQVPALMMEGLTLVVTPLISLMKDQVDNLRERGIRAACIHSGLSRSEHKLALDRARMGKIKMLYLSPEKLQSKSFADDLERMNVSMIVVDEAHCISQWGYDFRPSYLKIAKLRRLFPDAVVLALTASATPEVVEDIMTQLEFRRGQVFRKSFSRDNISYLVRHADSKRTMLLKILSSTSGSAIVYVRSRRRTAEIAAELRQAGITADYYHAGLSSQEKDQRQNDWKEDRTRVIVATNAFGMGIDKPDVRVVVHVDPPSSLEEYYQEAGRAGRDGRPSFAVILASPTDKALLTRRLNESFPAKEEIRRVYELAGNFLEVAVGSGYNQLYEFNFALFCDRFRIKPQVARSALSILTRAGYIEFIEEVATQSRIMMTMNKRELYEIRVSPTADAVLQALLRTYTGVFADFVHIAEEHIAYQLRLTGQQVYEALLELARRRVLSYVPRKSTPYIYYTTSRELPKHVYLPRSVYEDFRQRMERRVEAMKQFVFADDHCRVSQMLRYFGEEDAPDCGHCDYCRSNRPRPTTPPADLVQIRQTILYLAAQPRPTTVDYIAAQLCLPPAAIIPLLRQMADDGEILLTGLTVTR